MKNFILILFFLQFLVSCKSQNLTEENYVYSQTDSIGGQIRTAERLRIYMDNKEYEKAIGLFSIAEQQNIEQIKE